MCPVSLMHVIIALGAVPILAHVLPSTFSSFRCSVPLKAGLTGLQRAGLVLVPHSMAKMVPVPGTRLFGCQLRGVFLTWAMAVTSPTALSSPALFWFLQAVAFLHHSPSVLLGCACRCPSLCPSTWHWDLRVESCCQHCCCPKCPHRSHQSPA